MSFQEFFNRIESPQLRAVAAHWNDVRGDRRLPGWSRIDPVAIARQLSILWSWRYDRSSDSFTGRYAGSDIDAVFGKSLLGADMREFFAGWNYEGIFDRHKRIVTEPCCARGHGLVFRHAGRFGEGERIIMPLAEDGLHGDGIVGATLYRLLDPGGRPIPANTDAAEIVEFFAL